MNLTNSWLVTISTILLFVGLAIQYTRVVVGISSYVMPGILWLIGFYLLHKRIEFIFNKSILYFSLLTSVAIIVVSTIQGFLFKFGINALDTRLIGILVNSSRMLPYIALVESLRFTVISKFAKNSSKSGVLVAIAVLFTFLYIPLGDIINPPSNVIGIIKFMVKTVLPMFSLNVFLTYIVLVGGALTSITYMCIQVMYKFVSPILPIIPWFVEGFTSIVLYTMFIVLLVSDRIDFGKLGFGFNIRMLSWKEIVSILVYVFTIAIMFSFIITSTRPFVVVSSSMEPTLSIGDVVIVKKLNEDDGLVIGDIIAFAVGNDIVVHRLIGKEVDANGNIAYITKGDALDHADPWRVYRDNILGKTMMVLPKIGLPIILFWSVVIHYSYMLVSMIVSVVLLYTYISRIRK